MTNKLDTLTTQEILDIMKKYDFDITQEDNLIKASYTLYFKHNDYEVSKLNKTIPYETIEENLKNFIIRTFKKQDLLKDIFLLELLIEAKESDGEICEDYCFGEDYTGGLIDEMVAFRIKTLNMYRELTGETNEEALKDYEKCNSLDAERRLNKKCDFKMVDGQVPDGCLDSIDDFFSETDLPEICMFSRDGVGRARYGNTSIDFYFIDYLPEVFSVEEGCLSSDIEDGVKFYGNFASLIDKKQAELGISPEEKKEKENYFKEDTTSIERIAYLQMAQTEGNYGDEPLGWALVTLLESLEFDVDEFEEISCGNYY